MSTTMKRDPADVRRGVQDPAADEAAEIEVSAVGHDGSPESDGASRIDRVRLLLAPHAP